jgi:uncharacterized membrane protein
MTDTNATLNNFLAAGDISRARIGVALGVIVRVIIGLLIVAIGVVAIGSGTGLVPLPFEMFELAERMPYIFRAHMISAAVALLLGPLVIMLRHRPQLHRMLGRVVGAFVVAGGLTALPVAIFSQSSPAARAGFFVQGLVWLYLLARGIVAIRSSDRRTHRHSMLAMYAVATGAVWFRVMTGAAIWLHLPFEPVYAAAAWLGWIVPLAVVLLLTAPSPQPSPRHGIAMLRMVGERGRTLLSPRRV